MTTRPNPVMEPMENGAVLREPGNGAAYVWASEEAVVELSDRHR